MREGRTLIFNQFEFLFVFLPLTVAAFLAFPRLRTAILIVASFAFYGISGVDHAVVLLIGTVWVWVLVRTDAAIGSRLRLTLAIAPPLLALIYYKYLGFLLTTFGVGTSDVSKSFHIFGNVIVPAGISFFTFHLLAYALDRHAGRLAAPSLPQFLLFMSFFPHLVAGPILRYPDVANSIETITKFRLRLDDVARFVGYTTTGLASKVLLADTLGNYITQLRSNLDDLGQAAGAFVIFGYSFQIYFDFFGYSLVAIGVASLFGFQFPKNFDSPYLSADIRDFWRRWHITLSFWIRDYLYRPLGGNEHYLRNILIVFVVCGLWHGAGWNFVLWGLGHALLVCLYHLGRNYWDPLPVTSRVAMTFTAVSLLWILFLFDFRDAARFLSALTSNGLRPDQVSLEMCAFLILAAVICFTVDFYRISENKPGRAAVFRNISLGMLFVLTLVFMDRSSTFIYFRF